MFLCHGVSFRKVISVVGIDNSLCQVISLCVRMHACLHACVTYVHACVHMFVHVSICVLCVHVCDDH